MKNISSSIIENEAKKMGFKIKIIDKRYDIFSITGNNKTRIFKNIDCGLNSSLSVKFANYKKLTYALLEKKNIPTPKSFIISKKSFKYEDIKDIPLKYPLVVKPGKGEHGDGVSVNIQTDESLLEAIQYAFTYKNEIIIQEFFKGDDFRIIVINNKFIAAMKRVPAHVIGDGKKTIKELINLENKRSERGDKHEKGLTKIPLDQETLTCLKNQGYTQESIPAKGKTIFVRKNANLSTGGISIDVTDDIHPEIKKIAEKTSKILGLKVCGIDYLSEDITQPSKKQTGGIIEVNHTPGLRGHHFPAVGKSRNIAKKILKLAFK